MVIFYHGCCCYTAAAAKHAKELNLVATHFYCFVRECAQLMVVVTLFKVGLVLIYVSFWLVPSADQAFSKMMYCVHPGVLWLRACGKVFQRGR